MPAPQKDALQKFKDFMKEKVRAIGQNHIDALNNKEIEEIEKLRRLGKDAEAEKRDTERDANYRAACTRFNEQNAKMAASIQGYENLNAIFGGCIAWLIELYAVIANSNTLSTAFSTPIMFSSIISPDGHNLTANELASGLKENTVTALWKFINRKIGVNENPSFNRDAHIPNINLTIECNRDNKFSFKFLSGVDDDKKIVADGLAKVLLAKFLESKGYTKHAGSTDEIYYDASDKVLTHDTFETFRRELEQKVEEFTDNHVHSLRP